MTSPKHFLIGVSTLCFLLVGSANLTNAQARLVMNGAKINLIQGAYLVIDNPATNAITRNSGHIISEGEHNVIKWNLANTSGLFSIPWGLGTSQYIPLSFTKTSGTGSGYFLFSTYGTSSQNSTTLPAGVTNFNGASGTDKSLLAVDRFWQINAVGYTVKPALSALQFTYLDNELLAPNNTTIEGSLTTQRWNEGLNTWNDFAPSASVNTSTNIVTLASLSVADFYTWWALDYVEDRHWVSTSSTQWSNPLNWSMTEAGTGGASVPSTLDAVFLDDNIDTNLSLDSDISVSRLLISNGYSGIIAQGVHPITIANNATLSGGAFEGGSAPISINGSLALTGTVFKSTSSTLDLKSNFVFESGSFLHHGGTVKFSGVTTQTLSGSSSADFNNIAVNNTNGVSFESNQNLNGVLTLATNTTIDPDGTNNNAIFTLRSTNDSPTSDASIAPLPAGAHVTGKVTIQRYMAIEGASNGRIYRYISSPLQNATVADIQNEIPITGTFTGTSTCVGCATNQSMFEYDETVTTDTNKNGINDSNDGYVDFPATTNSETMVPGKGYTLYVRGNTLSTARWDVRGNINAGNESPVTLPVNFTSSGTVANDGWNLVGNPFPATIDWNASSGWTKTNMDAAIYIRNNGSIPSQYASWNGVVGANGGSRYIALGQAFWVKGNGSGTPVLNANENVKSAGTQSIFFREAALQNLLRISLVKGTLRDESVIHFRADATNNFDTQADALKLPSEGFNLSTLLDDNTRMSINSLAALSCETTVKLGLENTVAGNYALDFSDLESLNDTVVITLVDNFKKSSTNIRFQGSYSFAITTDPLSYGLNRFKIIFNVSNTILDFTLSDLAVCEGADAFVRIPSQTGVTYSTSVNGDLPSATLGNGQITDIKINAKDLQPGENRIVVTGINGCNHTLQKEIVIHVEKRIAIDSVENGSVCEAGVVTLRASGAGESGSYNWFESASTTVAISNQHASSFTTPVLQESKSYFVSALSQTGCESTRVEVLAKVVQLEPVQINLMGDSLVSNYEMDNQWYFDDQLMEEASMQSLKVNQAGTYRLQVTKSGCTTSTEYDFTVTGTASETKINVTAYPNPVVDEVTIVIPETYRNLDVVTVLNSSGAKVGSIQVTPLNGERVGKFTMTHLPAGVYILTANSPNIILNLKLIKK